MKINYKIISNLNPCKSRFDNFISHYSKYSGNLSDFFSLENITYSDKLWVCRNLMTQNQKFRFAVACADSVFEIYHKKYPNSTAVSNLLDHLKSIEDLTTLSKSEIEHLRGLRAAAAYAAVAYAAAAYAAAADDDARETQEQIHLLFAKMILEEES